MLFSVCTCGAMSIAAHAAARDTPYCRAVRARAQSDADLLMMPRVLVQGIRFPSGSRQLDSGATTDEGFQLRAGLSFSPLDFYKGRATLRLGEAECERHEAELDLNAVLGRGTDDARLSALREQALFLRAKQADWTALHARASARLDKRIITVVEFSNVQRFVSEAERKLVQVEGDAEQLEARARSRAQASAAQASAALSPAALPSFSSGSVPALAGRYAAASSEFEREASSLRLLDDWRLQMTGGVIPQTPSDWYGAIELSFSLGGLVRGAHEESYVAARADALAHASDGVEARLREFRAELAALLEQTRRDLAVVERSLDVLRSTRAVLETSQAENVAQARELLSIQQFSVESDSIFLRAFARALSTLMERARG